MRRFTRWLAPVIATFLVFFAAACSTGNAQPPQEWVDTKMKDFVGEQMQQYMNTQPVPRFEYSAQRDVLIKLYEATVPTLRPAWHVSIVPGVGPLEVCTGMGAPLPFGVSLTSPEYKWSETQMPLSEPPGYYTNNLTTDATWALCDYGHGLEPVYDESLIKTYFHPVEIKDGKIVHIDKAPSIIIDAKQSS